MDDARNVLNAVENSGKLCAMIPSSEICARGYEKLSKTEKEGIAKMIYSTVRNIFKGIIPGLEAANDRNV